MSLTMDNEDVIQVDATPTEDDDQGPLIINDGGNSEEDGGHDQSLVEEVLFSSSNYGVEMIDEHNPGTSWFGASMLIVNAALGAGLLNFPSAFHQAGGVATGWIVQLAMLGFIIPALLILAYCSDWNGSKTLQDVLSFTWGERAQKLTAFCTALYCFGTCVTFLIIIGDQYDRIFASLYGHHFCHEWYLNRDFTVVVTSILFILPFCYPKKIDFLKHISSVGVVSVIYVTLLIIVEYYKGDYTPGEIKTRPTAWTDVFLVVPTICFGYQCHVSVVPIYSCFKSRNIKHFSAAVTLAIGICVFTYTVAATYGYLTFGSKVESDILKSYDARDPYVMLAIIAISIKTYTTYPILSFCGTAAVNDLWVDPRDVEGVLQVDPRMKDKFRVVCVTVWFFASLILAILVPNIGSVIQLLGSLAAVFIFIFPGMCLLRVSEKFGRCTRTGSTLTLIAGLYLAVGGFIFGCVFTQAIIVDFIQDKEQEIPLCVPTTTATTDFYQRVDNASSNHAIYT